MKRHFKARERRLDFRRSTRRHGDYVTFSVDPQSPRYIDLIPEPEPQPEPILTASDFLAVGVGFLILAALNK